MIFQLNYNNLDRYTKYFEQNRSLTDQLDYVLYDDDKINQFLEQFNYTDIFDNKTYATDRYWFRQAYRCNVIRFLIMYELGGIYIDSDVWFTDEILNLERDMKQHQNIVTDTGSLFFVKGTQHSPFMKLNRDIYVSEVTLEPMLMVDSDTLQPFVDRGELTRLNKNDLTKYFKHEKITTDYPHDPENMRLVCKH